MTASGWSPTQRAIAILTTSHKATRTAESPPSDTWEYLEKEVTKAAEMPFACFPRTSVFSPSLADEAGSCDSLLEEQTD